MCEREAISVKPPFLQLAPAPAVATLVCFSLQSPRIKKRRKRDCLPLFAIDLQVSVAFQREHPAHLRLAQPSDQVKRQEATSSAFDPLDGADRCRSASAMSPDSPPGNGNGLHHGHHHDLDDHVQRQLHTEAQDAFQPDNGEDSSTIAVVDPDSNPTKPSDSSSKPTTGLHSPPDSNNVDGSSDSELSDLDEAIANADDLKLDSPESPAALPHEAHSKQPSATSVNGLAPDQPEQAPTPEQDEEDIGEVLPDHWSGNVPVFKPNMDQFKDFKKFVCCPALGSGAHVLACLL